MRKKRLKKGVVISLYLLCSVGFCFSLYFIEKGFKIKTDDISYVNKNILEDNVPVSKQSNEIRKPFTSEDVEILNKYYDINDDENNQINSIIYYNNTYIQNSGVIYGSNTEFDVVSIYDGEVIKVDEDEILGKIIEIRHNNEVVSIYQLLDDVSVCVGQNVIQGEVIGKSGLSNILNNNKHKLYFELVVRGQLVNGEQYYGKKLDEI